MARFKFKLWDVTRHLKKIIVASTFEELLLKGSEKLGFVFVRLVLEEDGSEVDGDEILTEFSGSTLIGLREGETWSSGSQNDVYTVSSLDEDVALQSVNSPSGTILRKLLKENYQLIIRCLVVSPELRVNLSSMEYFGDRILKHSTESAPEDELLVKLCEVPDHLAESVFDKFLSALRRVGQEHVANIFRKESDKIHMSDEHYKLLSEKRSQLGTFLDPNNCVLGKLVDVEVFTESDVKRVESSKSYGYEEMARNTIDILMRKSDYAFNIFVNILRTSGQEHVANILCRESDKMPISKENFALILKKRNSISKFIDPVNGLLDKLVEVEVFTAENRNRVMTKQSDGYKEMALETIDILLRKSNCAFDKFLDVLRQTDQRHVAHILTGTESEEPLSDERLAKLTNLRSKILGSLDLEYELFDKLIASGVINTSDKERIEAQNTSYQRNKVFLDALARKANSKYDKFLQVLREERDDKVVIALEGLEINAKIYGIFDSIVSVSHREDILAEVRKRLEKLLVTCKPSNVEHVVEQLKANGVTVTHVGVGCISIRFRCENEASLTNLRQMYIHKTLNQLFTAAALCSEFAGQGLESLEFVISDDEFDQCVKTFREMALMSLEHYERLREAADMLTDKLVVTEQLLDKLPLRQRRKEDILKSGNNGSQVRKLFEIVSRLPDTGFTQLVEALGETGEKEATSYLIEGFETVVDRNIQLTHRGLTRYDDSLELGKTRTVDVETSTACADHCTKELREIMSTVEIKRRQADEIMVALEAEWMQMQNEKRNAEMERDVVRAELCGETERMKHELDVALAARSEEHSLNPSSLTKYDVRRKTRYVYPRLLSEFPEQISVTGLAWCDKCIYVVSSNDDKVHVYRSDGHELPELRIPGMELPNDLVTCSETKQLFVADYSGAGCVWRMSLIDHKINQLASNSSPLSLSLTSRRLLVTSINQELLLFGPEGTELNIIRPKHSFQLQHAVETSRGTFIVSQYFSQEHQISEIDVDGHVVRVYSRPSKRAWLCRLMIDSSDNIFVTDCGLNCILLLNSRLELKRFLLNTKQHELVENPSRICLVEHTRQLIVGSFSEEKIQRFSLQ